MNYSFIINQIIVLFLILFIGYFTCKIGIIDNYSSKKITSFVVNVAAPMLIISSMLDETVLTGLDIIIILLLAIALYIFLFLMTFVVPKLLNVSEQEKGIYKFMIMFSNVGFMGFPVVSSIFSESAIFHAAIFNIPFYILIYTLGIYLVTLDKEENIEFNYKKMFNPGVIAVFIGLFFFATKLSLPLFIKDTLSMIGSLTTPLSMIVIGASLSNIKIKNIFSNPKLYVYCFIKLLLIPSLVYFILKLLGFNGLMLGVPVIIAGMPVAANAVMLSKEFGGNEVIASEGVFISTLLSLISIPILVFMLTT